jgi:uncharacterized C2H2 Zn-finger protein
MLIESRLVEESKQSAQILAIKLPGLQRELEAALASVRELNSKIEVAESAQERAASFESRIGEHFQCPRCWIERHAHADLESISSDGLSEVLRCAACGKIEKFYARK